MIFGPIRRRSKVFGVTILLFVLSAAAIAGVRQRSYTAAVEVVLDPALLAGDPEAALTDAAAWLRSIDAARVVARSLGHATAARPAAEALSVGQLVAHVAVKRIPQTYALEIVFAANDPHLAATVANGFAAQLVSRPDRADRSGSAMRVVSAATADMSPQGPAAWLILAAGALAGIAFGALAAVVAERRFDGLTSGADIKSRLNLYHLGNVPQLRSVLPEARSATDAVVDAPLSGFAEAFRGILVAARQASRGDAKVFAITSALPGEGKSTTAVCLARSSALAGETVVLVDCDSRRSGASAALAGDVRGPGLIAVLRGECELDEALVVDRRSGAWILPSLENGDDLSPLLGGRAFETLIEQLRSRFDRVFVDTAPILAIATTRSILPLMDAAIMIVRWRATPTQAVRTALGMVPADRTPWSGAVLTQVDIRKQARYGDGDASAYYQQSAAYYR